MATSLQSPSSHSHTYTSNKLSASSGGPLRKASFANLARFFGLGGSSTTTTLVDHASGSNHIDEDDDDQEGENEIDEESLMWDAQAALIAHQPSLAIQRYTTAALPPHKSAAACLALGNLLTRGTGFATSPVGTPHDRPNQPSRKGKERASSAQQSVSIEPLSPIVSPTSPPAYSRFLHTFLGPSNPVDEMVEDTMTSQPDRKYDLVGNGWAMRKEGKRAVRDVEGMGVAGGWLVLGLGWVVDNDLQRAADSIHLARNFNKAIEVPSRVTEQRAQLEEVSDDDVIVMQGKSKIASVRTGTSLAWNQGNRAVDETSTESSTTRPSSTTDLSSATNSSTNRTVDTSDNMDIQTPHTEFNEFTAQRRDYTAEVKILKLLYDLLQPLLHLYRHGHIQAGDPVFLPPVTSAQLPKVLRPAGDHQKRRNAWALGGVVADKMMHIDALRAGLSADSIDASEQIVKDWKQLTRGVRNMASYILGMTADKHLREMYFRSIVNNGQCGLSVADDLVRQAAKRLDIIAQTPSEPPTPELSRDGYPFPSMTALKPPAPSTRRSKQVSRHRSTLSTLSVPPAPRRTSSARSLRSIGTGIMPSPAKGTLSDVSGTGHGYSSSVRGSSPENDNRDTAMATLRRMSNTRHRRNESNASVLSLFTPGSLKSTTSEASPVKDHASCQDQIPATRLQSATETLKRVRESASDLTEVEDTVRWPSISGWTMKSTPKTSPDAESTDNPFLTGETPKETIMNDIHPPTVRAVASSPNISNPRNSLSPPTKQHKSIASLRNTCRPVGSSASLLCPDMEIASIDPTLAAAELASALTKHVCCSVCAVKGVNFPECRKCGMRFCSRDCRVGVNGAGDGKKHLCGVWATRQKRAAEGGLAVPVGAEVRSVPGIAVSMAESLGKTPRANSSVKVM